MKNFIKTICDIFIIHYCKILVKLFYKNIWILRKKAKQNKSYFKVKLYHSYLDAYGCYIGIDAIFEDIPVFPHGLHGIFISLCIMRGLEIIHKGNMNNEFIPVK